MKNTITQSLLVGALTLLNGVASAQGTYDLCAGETLKAMPDGTSVPIWAYGLADAATGCTGAELTIPGPELQADASGNLTINLQNNLPESTSIVIPGQAMPAGSTPVWVEPGDLPTALGSTSRTTTTQRVRSFGTETAPGATQTYSWTSLDAGTLMYHSGTHPQKQLYMGLYGAIAGDPGVAHDNEVTLFYSEIDPDLNASIKDGSYATSIHYHAKWFLVNGEPYVGGLLDITAGAAGPLVAGESVLLRFLSAAGETHVPVLQGMHMSIIGEDGVAYSYQNGVTGESFAAPREQYSIMMPPLKTKDAIIRPAAGRYAIYDGNGYMTNPSDPEVFAEGDEVGGMLRFLTVGGGNDADGDGVLDPLDMCPGTQPGAAVDANGCALSQLDSDFDGVTDDLDQCANTDLADVPIDANGCGLSQITDTDNDGVFNDVDQCPLTPSGEPVDANGCSDTQLDDDEDGYNNAVDACPNTPAGEAVDGTGCSASQLDDDGDGVSNALDLCPATPSGEPVDANGCGDTQLDDDEDGYNNAVDACPNTPAGEAVDGTGCSASQLDDDGDGVSNALDLCPATPSGEPVDANGCGDTQLDDDEDGYNNAVDACPNTPAGEAVDGTGCSASQLDDDGDGVSNALDQCPNTPPGTAVDATGCQANVAPVAAADEFYLTNMESQTFAAPGVLGNDSDADGIISPITAVLTADANRGTLALSPDGSFTYTLEPNSVRVGVVATFSYVANDGDLDSNPAGVSIRQELSIGSATCASNGDGTCDWTIEGRSTANRGTTIAVYLDGSTAAFATVDKKGGPGWTIRNVTAPEGTVIRAEAIGQPNAIVTGFTVN